MRATQPQQTQSNNQIQHVNAIHTLRSGKEVDNQVVMPNQINPSIPKYISAPIEESTINKSDSSSSFLNKLKDKESELIINEPSYQLIAQFPNMLKSKKHSPQVEKVLEIFKQVKINIPLLDAIDQIPSYAKILKDMCTKRRVTQVPKRIFLASNISEFLSHPIPLKLKDPGCPLISCTIGNTIINKELLDLGAGVNIIPHSVYQQLNLGGLKPTKTTL